MAALTATWIASPPESQDHGRGGERIRETRDEMRKRFAPEHDVGDASVEAGYTDGGRHNPGSAVAFYGSTEPSTLWKPDGTALASVPSGLVALGSGDRGRLWVDESGGAPTLRAYDTVPTTARFQGVYSAQNQFINGSMLVWQRGTSFTITTGVITWCADRWFVQPTGATTTVTRQAASFAANNRTTYVIRLGGAVGMTALRLAYRMRAADVDRLLRATSLVTISFRMDNNTAGAVTPTYQIDEANAADNFSAVTSRVAATAMTAVAAGADDYQSVTLDLSAIGSIANGFQVLFNFGAITANNVEVSECLLEFGSGRSQFVQPLFDDELARCLPYYEKTFPYATAPAQNAGSQGVIVTNSGGNSAASRAIGATWFFKAPKAKATYTLTFFNPSAANNQWRNLTDIADAGTSSSNTGTINGADTRAQGSVGLTNQGAVNGSDVDDVLAIHATCDSELT